MCVCAHSNTLKDLFITVYDKENHETWLEECHEAKVNTSNKGVWRADARAPSSPRTTFTSSEVGQMTQSYTTDTGIYTDSDEEHFIQPCDLRSRGFTEVIN